MRIIKKSILFAISASTLPILMMGFIFYHLQLDKEIESVFDRLTAVAANQERALYNYLEHSNEMLMLKSDAKKVLNVLRNNNGDSGEIKKEELLESFDRAERNSSNIENIYVLSNKWDVIVSTNPLRQNFEEEFKPKINKLYSYSVSKQNNKEIISFAKGIYENDNLLGYIVVERNLEQLISIVNDKTGLGDTGETLLAMRDEQGDALFIAPLRFEDDAVLNVRIDQTKLAVPITRALSEKQEAYLDTIDYRDAPVFSVTRYLPGVDWGLVVKQDKSEALMRLHEYKRHFFLVLFFFAFFSALISYLVARKGVKNLVKLDVAAKKISEGDFSYRIHVTGNDEISSLSTTFNTTLDRLQETMVLKDKYMNEIEERKKIEKDLRESNDELNEFSFIASHDLKEPLRGIQNYVTFLKEDYGSSLGEEGNQRVQDIVNQTNRLQSRLDELLYYSRVGRTEMQILNTDMDKIVDSAIEMLRTRIDMESIEIRRNNQLPTAFCDKSKITEVYVNLISNAIKYNDKAEKWIEIGHEEIEGKIAFYVKDNGIGIPEKLNDRVFLIFKRLHKKTAYGGGEGVGLALVKKIIHLSGGEIWVRSIPTEGSTFYFTLSGEQHE